MNKDTYEEKDLSTMLETTEWDDVWYTNACDLKSSRVMLIGDSISRGYRHEASKNLSGIIYADNYATSKSIDNPHLMKTIDLVMQQEPNCKVIHFNNGLHGWHLKEEKYKEYYDASIGGLIKKYPDVKVIIGLTTPTRERDNTAVYDGRNPRVIARNKAAEEIAAKYGLPVTDLYGAIADHPEYYANDGVHLTQEGYALLAEKIGEKVREVLK